MSVPALLTRLQGNTLFQKQWGLVLGVRQLSDDAFARLNIYKDAEKSPKEMADHEYPKWLWCLLDPEPTKEELVREAQRLYNSGGYDAVFEGMPESKMIRLFRLHARERIKQNNAQRKGGQIV